MGSLKVEDSIFISHLRLIFGFMFSEFSFKLEFIFYEEWCFRDVSLLNPQLKKTSVLGVINITSSHRRVAKPLRD